MLKRNFVQIVSFLITLIGNVNLFITELLYQYDSLYNSFTG